MHWIKDKERAFRKIYSNLEDGGTFAFTCPSDSAAVTSDTIWSLIHPAVQHYSYVCDSNLYSTLATGCGFKVKVLAVEPMKYTFSDVDSYLDYFIPTMTSTKYMPDMNVVRKVKEQFSGRKPVVMYWARTTVILSK